MRHTVNLSCTIALTTISALSTVQSFSVHSPASTFPPSLSTLSTSPTSPTALFGGTGKAKYYSWTEEQYEIELTVTVPPNTKAKDVQFRADSRSVDLCLVSNGGAGEEEERRVLLDGSRKFRGQIDADGTFWTIADLEEDEHTPSETTGDVQTEDTQSSSREKQRQITVTMEKILSTPKDELEVIEYDWGGIYPDDESEILSKNYKEAETLDVRDYAASLGVDIDNIDMTKVDKTMFTSGLDEAGLAPGMIEELTEKGYAKEVTRQEDGREFGADETPFRSMGDGVSDEEMERARFDSARTEIPFLDTPSRWKKDDGSTVPLDESDKKNGGNKPLSPAERFKDPIDSLTVVKLKEILKREGLKVSGKKQELRDRLKAHVRSILLEKKDDTR